MMNNFVLIVSCVLIAATTLASSGGYRADVFKAQLTSGKHWIRLPPIGSTAKDMEDLLAESPAAGVRSPLLAPLNQDLYFPSVELHIKDVSGVLVVDSIAVVFEHAPTIPNFVAPPFHFALVETNSENHIIPSSRWKVPANVSSVEIPVPAGDDGMLHVNDLPIQMTATLHTERMLVSTYVYDVERLPKELLSGNLYDLNPGNSTMMVKFLAKYDAEKDDLGVWVSRRSPIPDFTLVLGRGDEAAVTHNAASPPPGGLGIDNAFSEVKDTDAPYVFMVHFYENYAEPPAVLELSDKEHDAIIKALRGASGEGPFINLASYQLETNSHKTSVYFKYYNDTKHIAVQLLHKMPILSVMVSVYDENGAVLFRENERILPFSQEPFGWYYVIPTLRKEDDDDEPELTNDFITRVKRIELHIVERAQLHPAELMALWLKDDGANVDDVRVADNIQRAFASESANAQELLRLRGLVANRDFKKGDVVASIPYKMLLTHRIVEANEWCHKVLVNGTNEYSALASANGFQKDGIHFMLMTLFAIIQPHHTVDGTNWRLYFDTWPKDHPPLPLFYSDRELEYFAFNPNIQKGAHQMRRMWEAEYDLLAAHVPWVKGAAPLAKYLLLRSHVESRVVNASGTLLMLPLMDFMNHADDPSVSLTYSDEHQSMMFIANDRIPADSPITTNYGSKTLSKRDFLMQFGFIPPGAIDSVEVEYDGASYHLTRDTGSRNGLRQAVENKLKSAASVSDEDADAEPELTAKGHQALVTLLQERLQQLPLTVTQPLAAHPGRIDGVSHLLSPAHAKEGGLGLWASRLLNSEREVLQLHLTSLASTSGGQ